MRHAERSTNYIYIKPQDEECAVKVTPNTCTILFINMDKRTAIRVEAIISSSRIHGRLNNDASSTAAKQHSHIKHGRTKFTMPADIIIGCNFISFHGRERDVRIVQEMQLSTLEV